MQKLWTVSVTASFSAAHFLPNYHGKCENLHGHNWKVEVALSSSKLENGMVVDFKLLKKWLKEILNSLDHTLINDLIENPTAENIADFISQQLEIKLKESNLTHRVKLSFVKVWETEGSCCSLTFKA